DARYLRTDARRARWAATRALGCRDDTGRQLADFLTWCDRPEAKIHGSENRIADLHAVGIENLLTRVFHADLVNHTGRLIDGSVLPKRSIGRAVARRLAAAAVIRCHGLGDNHRTCSGWGAVVAAGIRVDVVAVVAQFTGARLHYPVAAVRALIRRPAV